jgi:hypothetical protein
LASFNNMLWHCHIDEVDGFQPFLNRKPHGHAASR